MRHFAFLVLGFLVLPSTLFAQATRDGGYVNADLLSQSIQNKRLYNYDGKFSFSEGLSPQSLRGTPEAFLINQGNSGAYAVQLGSDPKIANKQRLSEVSIQNDQVRASTMTFHSGAVRSKVQCTLDLKAQSPQPQCITGTAQYCKSITGGKRNALAGPMRRDAGKVSLGTMCGHYVDYAAKALDPNIILNSAQRTNRDEAMELELETAKSIVDRMKSAKVASLAGKKLGDWEDTESGSGSTGMKNRMDRLQAIKSKLLALDPNPVAVLSTPIEVAKRCAQLTSATSPAESADFTALADLEAMCSDVAFGDENTIYAPPAGEVFKRSRNAN